MTSEENPAHHVSRGLKAKELIVSYWFTGPDFLRHGELPSRDIKVGDIAVEDSEVRKAFVHNTSTTENLLLDHFLKFFSWTRLIKAIARLMRPVKQLKCLSLQTNEATGIEERKEA